MTVVKPTFLTDVTAAETDDICGMKFWHSHLSGGAGMINKRDILPDALDKQVHLDLRAVADMETLDAASIQGAIDEVLAGLTSEEKLDIGKMELLYRRLGWVAAFAIYQESNIREEFETMPVDP